MSECKGHAWDGIICKNCKADIFDLYYDLRVKLEMEEKKLSVAVDVICDAKLKNKEFADITDEYVANGYKLADAVEKVELENRDLKLERDELFPKLKQLESQVAVMRQGFETIKNNCEAGTDDYIWGVAHEMLEGAPTEASKKLQELEKYAELGRLTEKTIDKQICNWHCMGKFKSQLCDWYCKTNECDYKLFCQKRAELFNKR